MGTKLRTRARSRISSRARPYRNERLKDSVSLSTKPLSLGESFHAAPKTHALQWSHEGGRIDITKTGLPPLQPKLAVGMPGDKYEREAEQVANGVTSKGVRQASESPARAYRPVPLDASTRQGEKANSKPLPGAARAVVEPRLGHSFSYVRVHADTRAAEAAAALNARAFTTGADIFFGAGQYAPHSLAGQRLLAHELTHVIQQGYAAPLEKRGHRADDYLRSGIGSADEGFEQPLVPNAATEQPPIIQASFISFVLKMGAKQASKGILKNFIKTQIKGKISKIAIKNFAKRFAKEADDLISILEDPWWATAIGFIPIAGDAFDLVRVPKQIQKAMRAADRLEAKVKRVLRIQGRRARDLIPESLRRVEDYPSELEHLTYAQIVERAGGSEGARKLKKLIEQQHRLLGK